MTFSRSALLFILLLLAGKNIPACDCPDAKPLGKEFIRQNYPVVFYGKVLSMGDHDGKFFVKFKVIEPYIGKLTEELEIVDPNSDCSPGFGEGQEWLIYARYVEYGKPGTNICTPSRKFFSNEKDDFNVAVRKTTFSDDRELLRREFGVQPFFVKDAEQELLSKRELIKPKGYGMVWMVLIGTFVLALFYYLFNKFFK